MDQWQAIVTLCSNNLRLIRKWLDSRSIDDFDLVLPCWSSARVTSQPIAWITFTTWVMSETRSRFPDRWRSFRPERAREEAMTNIKQKVLQCGAFLLVVSLFVFFYVSSSQQQQGSPSTGKFLRPLVHSRDTVMNITKTILLWKNSWGYRFGKGRSPFLNSGNFIYHWCRSIQWKLSTRRIGCRVNNCLITDNSTLFPEFDAYVVHPPTQKTPWLLTKRRPDQIFVLFSTEPPYHMPDLNPFENYFNWTMSYRRGSDFRLVYGEIEPLESAPRSEQEILSLRQNVWASGINPARAKTKLAVWLVSRWLDMIW